jgi:hypothetical protein
MKRTDMMAFDSTRTFGIEIEAYGVNADRLHRALEAAGIECDNYISRYFHSTNNSRWQIKCDGSLRGLSNSFELVSPILIGQDGLDQVKKVCSVLTKLKAKINSQCGLHVHHGAEDLSVKEVKNLIALYGRMEGAIDRAMPESRRNNLYCQSLNRKLIERYDEFNRADSFQCLGTWMRTHAGSRYNKINIMPLMDSRRTVEFRHHSGTVEATKIVNWIVFTQLMIQRAARTVKVVAKTGDRWQLSNPWRLVFMDMGLVQKWREADPQVVAACQHIVDRIKHFQTETQTTATVTA